MEKNQGGSVLRAVQQVGCNFIRGTLLAHSQFQQGRHQHLVEMQRPPGGGKVEHMQEGLPEGHP